MVGNNQEQSILFTKRSINNCFIFFIPAVYSQFNNRPKTLSSIGGTVQAAFFWGFFLSFFGIERGVLPILDPQKKSSKKSSLYGPSYTTDPTWNWDLGFDPIWKWDLGLTPFKKRIFWFKYPLYTPLEICKPNFFRKSTCICWIGSLRTQIILTLRADNTVMRDFGMCGSPLGVNDGWHTELHC